METLVLVLDLVGTFVFALSGAVAGVRHRLDLFGVLVLAFAAGNAGGIARDLLIGAVPPAAISDWRYLTVSLLAGIVTFWRPFAVERLRSPVLLFDAAGLALFAVAGTQKALAFGLGPVMAVNRHRTRTPPDFRYLFQIAERIFARRGPNRRRSGPRQLLGPVYRGSSFDAETHERVFVPGRDHRLGDPAGAVP
jgi:Glycine transporter